MSDNSYDLILVGSSFASAFFLLRYLEKSKENARVLMLEQGYDDSLQWRRENKKQSSLDPSSLYDNQTPEKPWVMTTGLGGGSNCWWAVTPRMLPSDMKLKSTYGVGEDWPFSYEDLEPYYEQAESIMQVSGAETPYPKLTPYPQPPHTYNAFDELMLQAYPNQYFHQPTGRARKPTSTRAACCATTTCDLCPINAKFMVKTDLSAVLNDPRVTVLTGATALSVEHTNDIATGVTYRYEDKIIKAKSDMVGLGANAIFNPFIMLKSGFTNPVLGKYLTEQRSVQCRLDLDGVDSFQGSTSITGFGYMFYDGEHRRERAAALLENYNVPYFMRLDLDKWQQTAVINFILEDIPSLENYVAVSSDGDKPLLHYKSASEYTLRTAYMIKDYLNQIQEKLPMIENVEIMGGYKDNLRPTDAHVQCTTRMGSDPETSVLDPFQIHHKVRNLAVLGAGSFPTCAPAHPTLTLSALSLRSADYLLG